MEQIERFVVLPNKLTVPFSPEVPMQVVFLIFNFLMWFPTLGFQMSSTEGSFKDNPCGGKVGKARIEVSLYKIMDILNKPTRD